MAPQLRADELSLRVLSCDGKTSTITAPPGYSYVWFKASYDSLLKHAPNYWDSLLAEGTFRKDGSLKGKFSISDTEKVYFSQGNLEYHAYSHKFRFAREQWYTSFMPYGYRGQRDDNGWTPYMPWDSAYAWSRNIEIENSTYGHEWFVLTQEQWEYLFRFRKNASKRWGYCVIEDMQCLVLLPDSWSAPAGLTFTPQNATFYEEYGQHYNNNHPFYHVMVGGSNIGQNRYTIAQWREMEKKGAVAFPFSGFVSSQSKNISGYATYADYWLATPYNSSYGYGSFINSGTLHLKTEFVRAPNYAFMVRMVRKVEDTSAPDPPEPAPPMIDTCITIDWNQMAETIGYGTTILRPCDTITTERRFIATKSTLVSNRVLYTDGLSAPKGHKILVHVRFKSNFSNRICFYYNNGKNHSVYCDNFVPNEWCDITTIIDGFFSISSYWSGSLLAMLREGEYISLPNEGGMVYFDLTQMFGEGNEPTQEQFLERFPEVNYPYTAGELRQICDFPVVDTLQLCPHQSQPLAGALKGLFSVSDSTQVQFSQGNLQYQPSTKTWRFAEEQWETLGTDNNKPTTTMTKWMDLFAWGCSGYSKGITWYNPVRRGLFPRDTANFWIAGDWRISMTGEYAEVDWGMHNAISNGGNEAGLWRTMTSAEWYYLMFGRPNANQRRAYVDIDGNRGLVFLPDEWTTPDGLTIITDNTGPDSTKVDSFFLDNRYTMTQWRQLEQAGAVFLPATGICSTSGQYIPTTGWYWTASSCGATMSRCLHFNQSRYHHIANLGGGYRTHGMAVRLVIDKAKMDSLQLADNRLLRKFQSVEWNQLVKDLPYDHNMARLDTTLPDENRYEILKTEVSPKRVVYTAGTNASYGRKVLVHIRFKSNFTEPPYLRYFDGKDEVGLYPNRYQPNEWCTISGIIDGFVPGALTGFLPDSCGYHAGEYLSFPKDGGFMIFDLTRMFGSGYEPSLDEFLRLFPQDNFPYEKGRAVQLCNQAVEANTDMSSLDYSSQYTANTGILNGFFSVAADRQIQFSRGNLQYQPSTNTWRFAEKQYDISGINNASISPTTSQWIDLFGWGTSGWSSGARCYQPWSTEQNDTAYFVGGKESKGLTGEYAEADWGVHQTIRNGGNQAGIWRTMTMDEMRYLLELRPNAAQLRTLATVEGQHGIVLLPDDWTCPAAVPLITGNDGVDSLFLDNQYNAAQWTVLEKAGAVFLPLAGLRFGQSAYGFNSEALYWGSDPSGRSAACFTCRNAKHAIHIGTAWRSLGLSVRLVMSKEQAETALNDHLHYDSGLQDNVDCPLAAGSGRNKPVVEVEANGVYKLTLELTSGYPDPDEVGSFRMNFPLSVLEGHETDQFYVQFKYKRLQGRGDFTKFDWCDRTPVEILKEITTENYTYVLLKVPILAQKKPSIQYSESFRYLDVNSVYAGDVYRIWDIKLGANPWADPIDGAEVKNFESFATTGVFSVGEDKQMLFSPGNLQYQPSTNTWRFAEQQYDAMGVRNQFIAPDYTGWIDLFGWGTSGYDAAPKSMTLRNCYPWSYDTLKHNTAYSPHTYMYGPGEREGLTLTGDNALYDWGVYNAIANGGNIRGLWRTPLDDEFQYMMNLRPNAAVHKAYATICGSKGMILLPDSCELPAGFPYVPSNVNNLFESNIYTFAQWKVLERLGAMFLPTTSNRHGKKVRGEDPPNVGYYWTADSLSAGDTTFIGQAVRLATEVISTDSQIVVKADSAIWCCRISSPDTTYILAARAIGRLNYYAFEERDTICEGETYTWHEQTITEPGTYYDSLLTQYGCDSVYTLHLAVLQHSDSIETASICEGESYDWHGRTYSSVTYATDTLVAANGCDSICELFLLVKPQRLDTILPYDAAVWPEQIDAERIGKVGYPTDLEQSVPNEPKQSLRVSADGKSVYFSPGNLQYRATTDTWRFAKHQYDVIKGDNAFASETYNGWIDLFGWGTSGYNGQLPYLTASNNNLYASGNQDITGTNYDWCLYNRIDSFSAGTWRTMTKDEWQYLLTGRPKATQLRGAAKVNGVYGLVFLPDEWTLPNGLTFTPDISNYTLNNYTPFQWMLMEGAGAVFLPCGGVRKGLTMEEIGEEDAGGHYSSTSINAGSTTLRYLLRFHKKKGMPNDVGCSVKYMGMSVRPVREGGPIYNSIADTICYQPTYHYKDVEWNLPTVTDPINHPDVSYTLEYRATDGQSLTKVHLHIRFPYDSVTTASICEGETYIWHGRPYTSSIDTTETLVNAAGCDSTCTLHLTVFQHSDSIETASICEGETYIWHGKPYTASIDTTETICEGETYIWHGRPYTSSIDTTETLVNAAGCDSTCTLHLTVFQHSDSIETASICEGETYIWHGRPYTSSIDTTETLVNAAGCDSTCTLHLTVLQHSDSIETASICAGETYIWHGRPYTSSIDTTETLVNAAGCDSVCTLHLTVLQHSDSIETASICEGETYIWHGKPYTASIDTTATLVNAAGCDSVCTLHLTVLQHSDSIETASICEGETYTWHGRPYTSSIDTTETLVNAAGCDSTCTLHLTVNPKSYTTIIDTISSGATYEWNDVTYTETGTYQQTLVNRYMCDSIVMLYLTKNEVAYEVQMHEQCADDPYLELDIHTLQGIIHRVQCSFSPKAAEQHFRDTMLYTWDTQTLLPIHSARAGVYELTLSFLFRDEVIATQTYPFTLRYPSAVLDQRWDDFIGVLTHDYNGGYDFVAFQWYKDGLPIVGANHSYLYQPLENGAAYAAMLEEADGTRLMTCELIATLQSALTLNPTLVLPQQLIELHTSQEVMLCIYDNAGKLIYTDTFKPGDHLVPAPPTTGIYIVQIHQTGENGITDTRKLIVR